MIIKIVALNMCRRYFKRSQHCYCSSYCRRNHTILVLLVLLFILIASISSFSVCQLRPAFKFQSSDDRFSILYSSSCDDECNDISMTQVIDFSHFNRSLGQVASSYGNEEARSVIESMERMYTHYQSMKNSTSVRSKRKRRLKRKKESFFVGVDVILEPTSVHLYNALLKSYAKSRDDDVALQAEAILYTMQQNEKHPNIESYNCVLECWSNYRGEDRVLRTQELLSFLEKSGIATTQSYNSVILSYLRGSTNATRGAIFATDILDRMEGFYLSGKDDVMPNSLSYTATITCWANAASTSSRYSQSLYRHRVRKQIKECLNQSLTLLHRMNQLGVQPNVRTYTSVVQCLAWKVRYNSRSDAHVDFIRQFQPILQSMKRNQVKPNAVMYGIILDVLGKCGAHPRQCDLFLKTMIRNEVYPNSFHFASTINSFVNSNLSEHDIVKHAFRLFNMCPPEYRNNVVHTSVINALAKLASIDKLAAKNATVLHNSMISSYNRTQLVDFKPTTLSFSSVINCWSKSKSKNSLEMARMTYNDLERWYMKTRDPELFVDTVATNALMDALARSASKHNNLALECQHLLKNMSNPDHRSYGACFLSLANTRSFSAALNATKLFDEMITRDISPTVFTYTTVLNSLSKAYRPALKSQIQQLAEEFLHKLSSQGFKVSNNAFLSTVVLDLFGKCGDLHKFQDLYTEMTLNEGINLTAATHHTIVSSYIHNDNPKLAKEYILKHSVSLNPKTYNIFLNYLSKNRSFLETKSFFEMMEKVERVNVRTFTIYIGALSKLKSKEGALEADQVFDNMKTSPNLFTYNALLSAWSKSKSYDSIDRCKDILTEMRSKSITPDVISYSYYVNSIAHHDSACAIRTLDKIHKEERVVFDVISYFSLLCIFASKEDVSASLNIMRMMRKYNIKPDKRIVDLVFGVVSRSCLNSVEKEREHRFLLSLVQ